MWNYTIWGKAPPDSLKEAVSFFTLFHFYLGWPYILSQTFNIRMGQYAVFQSVKLSQIRIFWIENPLGNRKHGHKSKNPLLILHRFRYRHLIVIRTESKEIKAEEIFISAETKRPTKLFFLAHDLIICRSKNPKKRSQKNLEWKLLLQFSF